MAKSTTAASMLSKLQRTGSLTVRARSLRTGRPVGRPFTIQWMFRPRCGYQIVQDDVVQEEFSLDRLLARDWMTRLVEVAP
jgi:hypothetical protein